MRNLSLLLPYLRRYRGLIALGMFIAAVSTGFSTIPPYLLGMAVDQLRGGGFQVSLLLRYSLLIVAATLADGALKFGMRQLVGRSAYFIEYDLRNDLFRQLLRLDQNFYSANHTGDLMTRATNDLSAVRQMLGPGINSIVTATLTFIIVAVLMLQIDVQLGLITLLLLPTISATFVIVGKRMRQRFRHVQDQFGRISTRAQENFSGIRTIKAYAQEEAEMHTFNAANREYQRLNLRYVLLAGLVWPLMTLLLSLTVAIVLLVGGQAVAEGRFTLGEFVRFNSYLALLTWPMIALGWTVTLIQQGSASMGRISDVLKHKPAVQSTLSAPTRPAIQGEIELRNVGVRYGETWVLHNISFQVPRGSSVAIVGSTGAGKTTLVNLLGRVLDPTEGQVCIDGVDVRDWPLDQLRSQIGFVPQDTFLFSVPLRDNVTFGRPDASQDEIDEALLVSQLINDVPQFPQGIDTLLGERGVTLSGGQKQRTAIARAVLRDPSILVLDDSMSSVDTHTAAEILKNLKRVMRDRTSIVIAQRIATVKDADRIFVLHHGEIVEQGTHAELVQHNGRYAAMYRRELLRAELEENES
ncbi:MAG: ABC transporter ATP-binding protein [Chloroflexi bacterium]|nr:ABC transporter ATP-binding protein [Chloroflexota bacterium]